MKKTLLTPSMGYYRANLHCHSTVSDGKKTPEELKEFYRSHGYSAVAFTDHQAFITHNDLTDDTFVAPGYKSVQTTYNGQTAWEVVPEN